MSVSAFPYGAIAGGGDSGPLVQLSGASLSDDSVSPTDAEVGYQLSATGNEQSYEGVGSSYVTIAAWLLSGSASDYDVRCTVNSGTTPAGSATGSFLNLGSARAWTLTDSAPIGPQIVCNLTIDIVATGTSTPILASETVTMAVQETP